MKQKSKLTQKQEHLAEHQTQAQTGKEFTNSDELLRFDAAQTPVPPEIAERLKKSSAEIAPPPSRSWWRRMFNC
jgi:hypothetical protein